MGSTLISYRRDNNAGWAGRLSEHLKGRLGHESNFMDIDTIAPGVDCSETLQKAKSSCDVLLAVIGGLRPPNCAEFHPLLSDQ